ncbi:MAG: choice-of-anchor Q domain-containing protein [Rudaea sp.]
MNPRFVPTDRALRRMPLAACVSSILALAMPSLASADSWVVNSCDEDAHSTAPGPNTGTLRWALDNATSPAVIDMTGLTDCIDSKITLATGELNFGQDSVTINGPGASVLSIDGSAMNAVSGINRVLHHHTTGATLTIHDLAVTGGHISTSYAFVNGGCIFSQGNVVLVDSVVSGCHATNVSAGYLVKGGGIYSNGTVTLNNSRVHDNYASANYTAEAGGVFARYGLTLTSGSSIDHNSAVASFKSAVGAGAYVLGSLSLTNSTLGYNTLSAPYFADGGGAFAYGGLSAQYSTIDHNSAISSSNHGCGGGIDAGGVTAVTNSTISSNSATNVGGLCASETLTITNSTISGNSGDGIGGGVYAFAETVRVYNSTIAFNTAGTNTVAPGLAVTSYGGAISLTLQSSVLSNNTYASSEIDLSAAGGSVSLSGNNNLVRAPAPGTEVPTDTIQAVCPLLGPLRDNGGPTKTHALFSTSPAIDVGNSTVVSDFDQRGSAATNGVRDYLRISGPKADIGAYEVQQDDVVFDASFEGCPPLA